MANTPTIGLSKLSHLRGREQLIHIVWGVVRWFALALSILTIAFFVDWIYDQYRDTPMWVRVPLTILQAVLYSVAGYYWVIRPCLRGPSLIGLAKRVEESIQEYDHRLITSIQLSQADAKTQGMSPELIGIVTRESEQISTKHDMIQLVDKTRLKWSLALLAWPVGLLLFIMLFFKPALAAVLLQRQFLANVDIPRDVELASVTKPNPWPVDEPVTVRFEVTSKVGNLDSSMKGKVFVQIPGKAKEDEYDLVWDSESSFEKKKTVFKANISPSKLNYSYRARIGDGRSRGSSEVVFEARPTVTIDRVWIQSPTYVPGRPLVEGDKQEIRAYNGSRAKFEIHVQKPIAEAKLNVYRVSSKGGAASDELAYSLPLTILPVLKQENAPDRYPAESDFIDLRLGDSLTAYEITVKDKNGFAGSYNPRGKITVSEPDLPEVRLIEERYVDPDGVVSEEAEFKGIPIPLGGEIKVEYFCRSKIGFRQPTVEAGGKLLAPAKFVYRIKSGNKAEGLMETLMNLVPRELVIPRVEAVEPWYHLDLYEVLKTPESGDYDIYRASFANAKYQQDVLMNRVEFHAVPSANPETTLSRLQGGGTFNFSTAELKKRGPNGELLNLQSGDSIEFYIEAYDCDPSTGRRPGESDIRTKEIKDKDEVGKIILDTYKTEQAIKDLEKEQRGVFALPKK
ncbi:MAG: hypothetical protein K8T89_00285 [Planctomycetes bacterium]|nr:hypothetical protein [Planctomycetota bacterium]